MENTTNTLSMQLRHMARQNGLCDEWFSNWHDDATVDELINMYLKGIDFSIAHAWLPNDFIKSHFDASILSEHGIFVDARDVNECNMPTVVFNGGSRGHLYYDHFHVGNIYVRHNSHVIINISDYARCFIEVYDDSVVTVENNSNNRIFVYQYGGKIQSSGNVLIRDKTYQQPIGLL